MQQVGNNFQMFPQTQRQCRFNFELVLTRQGSAQPMSYVIRDAVVTVDASGCPPTVSFNQIVEQVSFQVAELLKAGASGIRLNVADPNAGRWLAFDLRDMRESTALPLVYQNGYYYCYIMLEPYVANTQANFNYAHQPAGSSELPPSYAPSYGGQPSAHTMSPPAAAPTATCTPPTPDLFSSFSSFGPPSSAPSSSFCYFRPSAGPTAAAAAAAAAAPPVPPPALAFRQVTADFRVPERPAQLPLQQSFKASSPPPSSSFVPKHLCERKKLRAKVKSVDDLVQLNRAIDREISAGKSEARAMESVCRDLGLSRTRAGELRRMYKRMTECQSDPRFQAQIESDQVSLKTLQAVMKDIDTQRGYAAASPALRQSASAEASTNGSCAAGVQLEPLHNPEHCDDFKQQAYLGISPRGVAMAVTPHSHGTRRTSSYGEPLTDHSSPPSRDPTQFPLRVPSDSKATPGSGVKRSLDPAFVAGTSNDEHGPALKRVFHSSNMPTTSTFASENFFAPIGPDDESSDMRLLPFIERDTRRDITPLSFTTEETAYTSCDNFPLSPRLATPHPDDDDDDEEDEDDCRERRFKLANPFGDHDNGDDENGISFFHLL